MNLKMNYDEQNIIQTTSDVAFVHISEAYKNMEESLKSSWCLSSFPIGWYMLMMTRWMYKLMSLLQQRILKQMHKSWAWSFSNLVSNESSDCNNYVQYVLAHPTWGVKNYIIVTSHWHIPHQPVKFTFLEIMEREIGENGRLLLKWFSSNFCRYSCKLLTLIKRRPQTAMSSPLKIPTKSFKPITQWINCYPFTNWFRW